MLKVVQCHPSRVDLRSSFVGSFDFVADDGRGFRKTFVEAVGCRGPLVYLQDDSILCPDFDSRLNLVVGMADVVMLYCNRKETLLASPPFVCLPRGHLTMAVGLLLSQRVCAAVPEWEITWGEDNPNHHAAIDYCLRDLLRHNRWSLAASVPSIVQHRDESSLLGHPCGSRKSRSYTREFGEC